MTITLYLLKENLLIDLKTLKTIFDAKTPELVEPLNGFLRPLSIMTHPVNNDACMQIQVTIEEFALIGVFNKNNLRYPLV